MIIKVGGHVISKYNEVNISLHYDSIASTFRFKYYFDPSNPSHRAISFPGRYQTCQIWHENILLITGRILINEFSDSAVKELSTIAGYSITGVLEDCPCVFTPLESINLSLRSIAEACCRHYDIKVVVDPEVKDICDTPIPTSTPEVDETVKHYLDVLCSQRNVILSHTAKGELLLTKSKSGKMLTNKTNFVKVQPTPLGRAAGGGQDIEGAPESTIAVTEVKQVDRAVLWDFTNTTKTWLKMHLSANIQKMHSDIVVMGQATTGNAVESKPLFNPYVVQDDFAKRTTQTNSDHAAGLPMRGIRPLNKKQSSGDTNTSEQAARNILADELKNITLKVEVNGWVLGGNLITPNQLITAQNPDCHLYKKTKFFIQDVDLSGDENSDTASITCVLPECYNNDPVVNQFGDNTINKTK